MNEDKKVYAVFDGEDLIGSHENGFEVGNHHFWYCDSKDPASFEGTNIMLSREQVIALLEWSPDLTGKNVYEFIVDSDHQLGGEIEMFKIATSKAASVIQNIGDYSNAELIEKLRMEEYGIEEQEKQRLIDEKYNDVGYSFSEVVEMLRNVESENNFKITEDAVKRPSHYMLEDGTEVKNHIRSILGDEGFKSWAIGNAIKYVSRYKDKGKPIQDLKKAQENIQMVIDVLGEQDDLD